MKRKICVLILIVLLITFISPTMAFAAEHRLGMYDMYRTFDLDAQNVQSGDIIWINMEAKKVVIKGNPSKTYTNVSIVCENAGGVDFIIEDLNLNTSTAGYECIKIKGPNNHIELRGSSHLTAGYNMPAIMVETGASLTITGYGKLTARGGDYGAAIGGRIHTGCGTVKIQGGNVTAIGGKGASGIGGGGGRIGFPEWGIDPVHGGNGGTVEISNNAVVYARGDWDDIGRGVEGYNSGSLSISGNAAVFFGWNGSDSKPAYINHSWAHHYIKGSYTFGYSLGGTPSSSITTRYAYTLTYDGNGGSGGGSFQYGQNETITLSDGSLFSKDGYTLMGWADAPDNIKDYDPNATFVMPAANRTLYAAWSPFDITYNLYGGTNHSNNPAHYVTADTPITLLPPIKTGHIFLGWYDGEDFSTANKVTEIPIGSEGNKDYWAKWNALPNRKASIPEADKATVTVGTPYVLDLSSVFEDEDGDSLTYEVSVDGAPTISANTNYTYIPASAGNTSLSFIANDGNVDSTDTYTVTLTANTTPNRKAGIPETDKATVTLNTPYTLNLSSVFEDEDGDSLTYAVSADGAPGISADENYAYTPTSAGETVLVLTANDGNVDSTDTYTVTLTANTIPNRKAGIPETDKATVTVGTPYVLDLSSVFEDEDSDSLTYEVSVDGAPTISANTNYTYIPASAGNTLLSFIANDGNVDSTDTYTVTLIVKPAPTPKPSPTPTPKPKPTKTPSPTQTQAPVFTPVPTQVPTTSPAAQKTEMPTNTPQPSAAPRTTIKPSVIEENKEQGTITVEINTEDLPEGTGKIVLPDGKTIDITKTETILLEISVEEIGENGALTIIPIDEEGSPLGNYSVEATGEYVSIDAEKGWSAISSALLWILIAAAVLAGAILVIYTLLKKKK